MVVFTLLQMKLSQLEMMARHAPPPYTPPPPQQDYFDNMTMCAVNSKPKLILQEICEIKKIKLLYYEQPIPENRLVVYTPQRSFTVKVSKDHTPNIDIYKILKMVVRIEVYHLFINYLYGNFGIVDQLAVFFLN